MEHYSMRLERNFQPGDWLYAAEVLEVLSANAGRRVSDSNLTILVAGGARSELFTPRRRVYLYEDVQDVVIAASAGRPRSRDEKSPQVRAQHAYRERQRKEKAQEQQEKLRRF
jgi:hypothetical protein